LSYRNDVVLEADSRFAYARDIQHSIRPSSVYGVVNTCRCFRSPRVEGGPWVPPRFPSLASWLGSGAVLAPYLPGWLSSNLPKH